MLENKRNFLLKTHSMNLKNIKNNFYINLLIIILVFLLDRISKIYVIYLADKKNSFDLFSSEFLNINLIWNDGIAFGLFSLNEKYLYNTLTMFIGLVIMLILFLLITNRGLKQFSLVLVFAGAIGNLYDRIFYKAVPDFIDFHIGEFHWFIFNVADIFITFGVIFMILLELIGNNKSDNEKI